MPRKRMTYLVALYDGETRGDDGRARKVLSDVVSGMNPLVNRISRMGRLLDDPEIFLVVRRFDSGDDATPFRVLPTQTSEGP